MAGILLPRFWEQVAHFLSPLLEEVMRESAGWHKKSLPSKLIEVTALSSSQEISCGLLSVTDFLLAFS